MHDMLSFVGQKMSRMMCGEACLADGCGTRSVLPRPCSDPPRNGTDSSGIVLLKCLRVVLS